MCHYLSVCIWRGRGGLETPAGLLNFCVAQARAPRGPKISAVCRSPLEYSAVGLCVGLYMQCGNLRKVPSFIHLDYEQTTASGAVSCYKALEQQLYRAACDGSRRMFTTERVQFGPDEPIASEVIQTVPPFLQL